LNIAIISPQIYPCTTGGFEIFNYYLIKELAEQGHKIWVITCCDHNWDHDNISNVKIRKRLFVLTGFSINIQILLKLKKLRRQIDVIHIPYTSNSSLIYSIIIAHKLFGTSYIITIHGGGMHPWRLKTPHKFFFKNAFDIIAVSKIVKEEYENRCNRKIKQIYPMIPFAKSKTPKNELRRKFGFSENDTILLSLGSIKRIKGNDILLDAFLNLGKEYIKKNNLKLLFVGEGSMRNSLEKIVNKEDINSNVIFLGKIPYEKVSEMYKLADLYVIPSLFEGTPISLLEAMFNGLPIIGSDTNGINNNITDNVNGLLFKVGDEKELSIKLKKLIENKNLRDKLSKNATKFIKENYNFKNTLLKVIEIHQNTMKKN